MRKQPFLKKFPPTIFWLASFFAFFIFGVSSASAVTPDQISGLKLWLDASSGVTSDGSTPAVDGNTVQQWNDRSSGGYNATQATAGSRPTYKTNIMNSQSVLRFAGAQNMVTASFLDASFNHSFTFFIVKDRPYGALKVSTGINHFVWFSSINGNSPLVNMGNLTPSSLSITPAGTSTTANPFIQTFRYDGATATTRFNGLSKSTSTTGNLGFSGSLTIGSLSDPSFYYDGDIAEIIIYNTVLDDTQIGQVESYLMTKYGIVSNMPSTTIPLFVFDGDSLTAGNGSTGGLNYPAQTQTQLGITGTYQNFGVGGQTVASMNSDAVTQIDQEYSSSRTTNIISSWGGVNDLAASGYVDAPTTYNRIVAYAQARRSAGFKVIVSTILPQSATGPVDYETSRQTVNNLVRSNWTTFADGISDIASDSVVGQAGAELNSTYYQSDKIHMTNVGYGIAASYVTAAIKQIMNPIVVDNISVTPSVTTASITWTTNQTGSTKINYGLTSSFGFNTAETDTSTRVLNHSSALSGLTACTTYHFQTVSGDLNGNQATSTDQSFATIGCLPQAPTIGIPAVQSSSVIRWNFSDAASDETGFRIYNNVGTIATSSVTTNLTYLDETGLTANTQYSGRYATAYNGYGNSASSSIAVSIYTLADTPTNFTATAGQYTMNLSVDSFSNSSFGSSGYSFSGGGATSGWIQTNTWSVSNLSCGTSYDFSVKYRNGDGVETAPASITKSTTACNGAVAVSYISQPSKTQTTNTVPVISQPTNIVPTILQPSPITAVFPRALLYKMTGDDVTTLQKILNALGYVVSLAGNGSLGKETNYYGAKTQIAVQKFQCKEMNICSGNYSTTGYGRFGNLTRGRLIEIWKQ